MKELCIGSNEAGQRLDKFLGKYMDQAKKFRMSELRAVMEDGADIEQRVKTGLLTDNLAVELFIVKHSGKAQA